MLFFAVACPFVCHPVGICFCRCPCFVVACSLSTHQKTSSRPKAAHFAAAAERSLYFAFALAVAFAFAFAVVSCSCSCCCLFYAVILTLSEAGWGRIPAFRFS